MTHSEILSAFNFRHACKIFDSTRKISETDFNLILESARLSPSSFGFEPWHFVIVQNPNLRNLLKPNAWGAPVKLDTASHFILVLTMKSPLIKWNADNVLDFMRNVQHLSEDLITPRIKLFQQFQNIDFDLTDDRKLFDWASKQSYIAMGNMMTVAAMLGIDSCPIEGYNQVETDKVLQEHFDIDTTQYGISYMLALGYRLNEPKVKTRKSLEQITTWK
jgi:nitroreductase